MRSLTEALIALFGGFADGTKSGARDIILILGMKKATEFAMDNRWWLMRYMQ